MKCITYSGTTIQYLSNPTEWEVDKDFIKFLQKNNDYVIVPKTDIKRIES